MSELRSTNLQLEKSLHSLCKHWWLLRVLRARYNSSRVLVWDQVFHSSLWHHQWSCRSRTRIEYNSYLSSSHAYLWKRLFRFWNLLVLFCNLWPRISCFAKFIFGRVGIPAFYDKGLFESADQGIGPIFHCQIRQLQILKIV